MRGNRLDLLLTALLSLLTHYALFTAIPLKSFKPRRSGPPPVEIEINETRSATTAPAAPPEPVALPSVRPEHEEPEKAPPQPRPVEPRPEPQEEHERVLVKRAPREERQILQSVDQPNPNEEETPENPHFLAQSNRNVEEETVARSRSLTQNDLNPGGSRPNPSQEEQAGTDEEEVARENQDRPGVREPDSAPASPGAPEQLPQPGGDGRHEGDRIAAMREVPRVDRQGIELEGPGEVETPRPQHQPGREGRAGRQGGRGPGLGPRLQLSWSQFEQLYGEGELRREREEQAELRRSRTKGRFAGNWERIRAAMENYVPDVRPGNQTALRAAASPFAVYLTQIHRRLHRLWAEGYLVDLTLQSEDSPLNDFTLMVNLEIIINPDGTVHKVGVVDGGSGNLVFDAAAIDTVFRSAPHPHPPHEIVSGDGRTYLHWAFYRNHRQCGTFNAEPFILPNPPSMPRDEGIGPAIPAPAPRRPPATEPPPPPPPGPHDADHEDAPTPPAPDIPLGGTLG
ncbi:MAG: energy transducer TonB [Deltaproteobacteria bacterium]|nr:energy transducer TonB [Deltaproteobacteria bacterium]